MLDAASRAVPGIPFDVDLRGAEPVGDVAAWCASRSLRHISVEPLPSGDVRHRLRSGVGGDPVADLPDDRKPGARLWMYTNFHCNLACDYCCVSSAPTAPRRVLPVATIARLATEAGALGTREIFLTGGEPFLRSDIAEVVSVCSQVAPTVVLTNGMLFRGARTAWLEACPRDQVTLQVSIDSAGADLHDRHRGLGSHRAALDGIRTALELGFSVRVAATIGPADRGEEVGLHRLCDELGLGPEERVIRRIAQQGNAEDGVRISRASVIPEICVTDRGVSWHPVGANDPSLDVFATIPPLSEIVEVVTEEFRRYRAESDLIAAAFPCG